MDTQRNAIGLCGASGESCGHVRSLIAEAGAWPVVEIALAALPPPESLVRVGLYVLASDGDGVSEELIALLRNRPDDTPLIVIGRNPAHGSQASIWFPAAPAHPLLASVIAHLLHQETGVKAPWRRKADMILGSSQHVRDLLHSLDQLAPAQTPVLITGESGVGKELVARALHFCSARASAAFIAVNCGAIPESLFESELFGYQKGAFTGAVDTHIGAFEAADNGTLFLDEIGEMPMAMQVKLLRVLETSTVQRVGAVEALPVNFRLVTATNRNLEDEVKAGRFRDDLFYRIHVYPLHVAPLRERPEDIPPIVQHQLSLIADRDKRPPLKLSSAALEKLMGHSWPGNVRELINVLERAALHAGADAIAPEHVELPELDSGAHGSLLPYRDAKTQFETEYYAKLLRVAGGNVSLAAKLAQKTRKEVYDAMRRLHLDTTEFRSGQADPDA